MRLKIWSQPQDYRDFSQVMDDYVRCVAQGVQPEALWFLEHKPVYTLGLRTSPQDLVGKDPEVPCVPTKRGGLATYHGPGQRVVYIIKKLEGTISQYLRCLQVWLQQSLKHWGVDSVFDDHPLGLWVPRSGQQFWKIASIGIRVHKSIAFHGFAVNIANDLRPFSTIQACGLSCRVTSLHDQGYTKYSMNDFDQLLIQYCPF